MKERLVIDRSFRGNGPFCFYSSSMTKLFLYVVCAGWQPPAGSKSFGAGHSGVAHDVELIQEGWLHLRGGDSAIYKQVRSSSS